MKITVGELRQLIRETIEENDANLDEGWKDILNKGKKIIRKLIPIATISLASVGCDAKDIHNFKCDGFTEEEIAIMQTAADEWCEQTDNIRCAVLGKEGDSEIKLIADVGESRVGVHASVIGPNPSLIKIKNTRESNDWEAKLHAIILHELGHHFAKSSGYDPGHLKHQEDGVMAPELNIGAYVSTKDVKYVNNQLTKDDLQ